LGAHWVILRAEQRIETLAVLWERQRPRNTATEVTIEVIIDTLGGVKASKLVKTWADTVIKVDTRTVGDTLGQLKAEALINTPGDALA